MLARSIVRGRPLTSLPRKTGNRFSSISRGLVSINSRNRTITRRSLGTSIPTVFFPGMGATTRTDGTRRAIAKSSANRLTFESLKPASSSSSNWVITGPVSMATTRTLRPNSQKDCSSVIAATWAFFARRA